jgi:uncharacterized OB-fold protein
VCCPACLSEDWEWVASSGRGTVYSYTVVHRPPGPGFTAPYVVAIVDLDEGWQMLTNLRAAPAVVRIGVSVRVAWEPVGDGQLLPVFELIPAKE